MLLYDWRHCNTEAQNLGYYALLSPLNPLSALTSSWIWRALGGRLPGSPNKRQSFYIPVFYHSFYTEKRSQWAHSLVDHYNSSHTELLKLWTNQAVHKKMEAAFYRWRKTWPLCMSCIQKMFRTKITQHSLWSVEFSRVFFLSSVQDCWGLNYCCISLSIGVTGLCRIHDKPAV